MQNAAFFIQLEIGDNSVEKAAVVPHDEIADPPAVSVDELASRCISQEFIQQRPTFRKRPPHDVRRVIAEIERFDAGFGMGADKRMIDEFLATRHCRLVIIAFQPSGAPAEGDAQSS